MLARLRAAACPFTVGLCHSVGVAGVSPPVSLLGWFPVSIPETCCHGNMAVTASPCSLLAPDPFVGRARSQQLCGEEEAHGVQVQKNLLPSLDLASIP